jgi:hypothetical protein
MSFQRHQSGILPYPKRAIGGPGAAGVLLPGGGEGRPREVSQTGTLCGLSE